MEERDIIERLLGRDESGLHDLLRYYGPLMRYIIAPIVPDPHHREDCLSEAVMRVWDRVGQFDPSRGSFNAWLTAVVRNTARNYQRAIQSHQSTQDLDENTPSPQPTPEELHLRQTVKRLPRSQRQPGQSATELVFSPTKGRDGSRRIAAPAVVDTNIITTAPIINPNCMFFPRLMCYA